MTEPSATLTRPAAFVSLTLSEDDALGLMALLIGAVSWARVPGAKAVYDALQDCGLDPTEEQCDTARHEIERYVEGTADDTSEEDEDDTDDVMVIDEDEDEYL